ncbi:MAG: heptosyltransferase [Geobacteraceae bacterium GWC2_58_44]|nr:MAG: heptosyltransferase [Geobacteraceae bacterium GWC2_58_44]HBG06031.1 glycosyltransferase family 9 protein [Geobacter sp.]
MKLKIIKGIDSIVGNVLASVLPGGKKGALAAPKSCLFIRPGGIGDAVLLLPAINAFHAAFPGCSIDVLAETRNAAAFQFAPCIRELHRYDSASGIADVLRAGYDLVIDTEQWHRLSAVVARLAAPVSIGFATNRRNRLFSHQIPYSHDDYETKSFFNLLAPLGIAPPAELQTPFLSIPGEAAARAESLLARISGRPFAVIFPGASIAERRWGHQRFREVAQRLVLTGLAVVVVEGGEDADQGDFIVRPCGGVNLAGKTSLAETAAVIARSTLLLSGDSGVLHMAVGLGIPTVSLFGPGIEAKWGAKGEGDLVLNRRLPCSPCTRFGTTPACPIQARCLSEITPQEVVGAINALLSKLYPGE